MRYWWLVVALAACKKEPCDKFAELVEQCLPQVPGETLQEMQIMCIDVQRAPRDTPSLLDGVAECAKATTCDELKACFERRSCSFVFSGPDDRTPSFMCR